MDRISADLRWVVESEPLLLPTSDQFQFSGDKFSAPYVYDEPIPVRLGRHFENLFEIAIKKSYPNSTITRSLKLYEAKRTIGEIDFIVDSLQIEIAVKFYLQLRQTNSLSDFVGPNKHDNLQLKVDKLRNWRVPPDLKITDRKFFLKGFLFYPLGTRYEGTLLNPKHNQSFWVDQAEVEELFARFPSAYYFSPLMKNEWISPICYLSGGREYWNRKDLQKLDIEKPKYIVLLETVDSRVEIARGFLLPKGWAGI